jgi:haloalkane dehalogenase
MSSFDTTTKTALLNTWMTHREVGTDGPTIVFLHGNPTNSHLWRTTVPQVADRARCLAPDLIGMGGSGKPDLAYRFEDHARHLDAWLNALVPNDELILVGHDWGGALAQDWAARDGAGRVKGIALIETFLRPLEWSEMVPAAADFFRALRTPGVGEDMVLKQNLFIERNLPGLIPGMSEDALDLYRAPFPDPDSRRPMLQFAREFPLGGEPAEVVERMVAYGRWMRDSAAVPKLLMTVTPAAGLGAAEMIAWARANSSTLRVQEIGAAGHHAPEQVGPDIGRALADWWEEIA